MFKLKSFFTSWIGHPFVPKSLTCLLEGYSLTTLRKDLIAGVTVGIVALPLAMAFAIASGVEPSKGLYTAVIAGFLISLLGGSKVQIGGPTGAFVVIVYATIQKHGYNGLVVATLMAAFLLVLMGLFRVGKLIRFVPYPLIVGFTAGLAVLIFTTQVKEFFGFSIPSLPSDFLGKWGAYISFFSTMNLLSLGVSSFALMSILCMRRFAPNLPWGILAIASATFIAYIFHLDVETIGSKYGELPHHLPPLTLPKITWDLAWFQSLLPDAVAIAILAGLESLLSALMADRMSGGRHKSDCELIGQGIANCAAVLFGGIPATGAISRTAANVKTGAKTPIAGMIHAATLLLIMLVCSPLVSHIPLAALSSVLMVVAWNMAEVHRIIHLFQAPQGDIAVMLTAFFLTILVDLSFAVQMAMLLALFLFMKRMSEKSSLHLRDPLDAEKKEIDIYELQGPLFFGMTDRIHDIAHLSKHSPRVFVFWMQKVPVLDASGMCALFELAEHCEKKGTRLLVAGVHEEAKNTIRKFDLEQRIHANHLFEHVDDAVLFAKEHVATEKRPLA